MQKYRADYRRARRVSAGERFVVARGFFEERSDIRTLRRIRAGTTDGDTQYADDQKCERGQEKQPQKFFCVRRAEKEFVTPKQEVGKRKERGKEKVCVAKENFCPRMGVIERHVFVVDTGIVVFHTFSIPHTRKKVN